MYLLFSWLSLSFWGCEQRPELGQPVILQEIDNKTKQQDQSSNDDPAIKDVSKQSKIQELTR